MTFDVVVLAGGRGRRLTPRPDGVSKAEVLLAGRTLLDRALDAAAGARRVVVVGPAHLARPGVVTVLEDPPGGGPVAGIEAGLAALAGATAPAGGHDGDRPHAVPADPAGPTGPAHPGGPAAGGPGPAGAGGPADADVPVLVLACDVPRAAAAVPALLAALGADPEADGAHLVRDGRPQLVAVHRPARLRAALDRLAAVAGPGAGPGGGPAAARTGTRGASVRALVSGLRMVDVPDDADLSADADTWDDVARLESVLARRDTMTAQTPDDLDRWAASVADALGVDPAALDRDLVLDLTRDVAHTVTRPAVPLTTFLMGMAVGAGGGDRAALDRVAARVAELTAAWGAADGAGDGAGSGA